jgi:hypothetical protein
VIQSHRRLPSATIFLAGLDDAGAFPEIVLDRETLIAAAGRNVEVTMLANVERISWSDVFIVLAPLVEQWKPQQAAALHGGVSVGKRDHAAITKD